MFPLIPCLKFFFLATALFQKNEEKKKRKDGKQQA